jgi:hypothetical protein
VAGLPDKLENLPEISMLLDRLHEENLQRDEIIRQMGDGKKRPLAAYRLELESLLPCNDPD